MSLLDFHTESISAGHRFYMTFSITFSPRGLLPFGIQVGDIFH